jgi:dihydroorotate dehydrogenase
LFFFDAESAHYLALNTLKLLCKIPGFPVLIKKIYGGHIYDRSTRLFGLEFPNPVGLAAGFDKNGEYIEEMSLLGFGFIEVGTVTPRPQYGNEKPRLFRLKQDEAIINRMGFNNQGVDKMVENLKKLKRSNIVIGGNIGKNKDTPNENAVEDYLICFEKLFPYVDYFAINISSPNTPGLRELQKKEALTKLLSTICNKNESMSAPKPVLLKIAPDMDEAQQKEIVEIVEELQLSGIIISNTTVSRDTLLTPKEVLEEIGMGGMSGKPLRHIALNALKTAVACMKKHVPIVSVGGIHDVESARERIDHGAGLIQVYTGFVYHGPGFAKSIKKGLTKYNS